MDHFDIILAIVKYGNPWNKNCNIDSGHMDCRNNSVSNENTYCKIVNTFTKDRPGFSSERAPHRDRTTNSRPKLLKRKQYLVKCPQSWLDTKTFWLTDWLRAVKWLWVNTSKWSCFFFQTTTLLFFLYELYETDTKRLARDWNPTYLD
jgi:hypothetical protein